MGPDPDDLTRTTRRSLHSSTRTEEPAHFLRSASNTSTVAMLHAWRETDSLSRLIVRQQPWLAAMDR